MQVTNPTQHCITPGALTLDQIRQIAKGQMVLSLPQSAVADMQRSADAVAKVANGTEPVYGVNTGFGKLASIRIASDDLARLQTNLIRSHAVGVGKPLSAAVVRILLATKAASLARGFSGVRPVVADTLLAVYNAGLIPYIPEQGSVGASGDLAPLAHLTLALMGEGEICVGNERVRARPLLEQAGIWPLVLEAKEGLALINGTQVSTALALHALLRFETVFKAAIVSGALSLDAARGSDGPFDPRIHSVRGQPGQAYVAELYRTVLIGSKIRASHQVGDDRVQDPYCLRCQPQVMGACLDQTRSMSKVLLREANAVTDNPLVFTDAHGEAEFISGGNFHAEPVALAADTLACAIAEVGAIAERRIAMLIDAGVSRLPPFLTADAGLNSGYMIAHVTAAALASENKSLAHPASVDSLPTSANQEDHVSMATFAARRLQPMLDNVAHIVAIETLAACQGIEFLRPLASSAALERVFGKVRESCPSAAHDLFLGPIIERARQLVENDELASACWGKAPELLA
jgi:histidine ammonia-lyase